MTNLDLICAIGEADSADLEHSERTRFIKRRRIGVRVLAAAVMIGLLSTTVFAIPAIRNALFGAKTKQVCISRIYVRDGILASVSEGAADVFLNVQMDPQAPSRIETCYVPMLPAEQWEKTPLKVSEGQSVSFEIDTLLRWEKDGEYIEFRQWACPGCDADYPVDTVCTGFEANYTASEAELGGYTVQRILVEPSKKEKDGFQAEHPGLQKLYWSDGCYLFSMEVNYDMSEEELAAILKSIAPVENVNHYVKIEQVPVRITPQPRIHLERVMYPAALPEGYVRTGSKFRQPNGGFLFGWLKGDSPLSLNLEIEPDLCEDARMRWETLYIADRTVERKANGIPVTGWENGFRAQIVWRFDGADYSLKSAGEEGRLSIEELLEIMEGLVPLENSDEILAKAD